MYTIPRIKYRSSKIQWFKWAQNHLNVENFDHNFYTVNSFLEISSVSKLIDICKRQESDKVIYKVFNAVVHRNTNSKSYEYGEFLLINLLIFSNPLRLKTVKKHENFVFRYRK